MCPVCSDLRDRLDGLCIHGGVVFDVDVELFKRDDIVRAVLAEQWATAILLWMPHYLWSIESGATDVIAALEASHEMTKPGPLRLLCIKLAARGSAVDIVAGMVADG